MVSLQLEPLNLEPVDSKSPEAEKPLDLEPLDLEPVASASKQAATEPTSEGDITDDDFQQMGQKYGVDPEELRKLAPYYGAIPAPRSLGEAGAQGLRASTGALGRTVGLGAPQFIYKKLQDEPTRKALDELMERGEKQRGLIEQTTEGVVAPLTALGKGAGTAARIGEAAGIGGALGLTSSREGEEARGAATGAAFGAALAGVGEALGKGIGLLGSRLSETEKSAIQAIPKSEQAEIDRGAQQLLEKRTQSEDLIEGILRNPDAELSEQAARTIVEEQLPERSRDLMDPDTPEGKLIQEKLLETTDVGMEPSELRAATEKYLANQIVESRTKDFAELLTRERPKSLEEAQKAIEQAVSGKSGQGMEHAENMYRILQREQAALEYIQTENLTRIGRKENFVEKFLVNPASDAQFPIKVLDERLGTSAGLAHSDLVRNQNKMTWARQSAEKDLRALGKEFPQANAALRDGRITDAIDSGNLDTLAPVEQQAASRVKGILDNWLDFVNNAAEKGDKSVAPLAIAKREDYIPHLMLNPEKAATAVQERMQAGLEQASGALGRPIQSLRDLKPGEYKALVQEAGTPIADLQRAVQIFDSTPVRSGADLLDRLTDSYLSREGAAQVATRARAALERTGEIPDWLRERNTYKLLDRWSQNTLRHLYLRQPLARLASAERVARSAGDTLGAGYLKRLMQDVNGIRPVTGAAAVRDVNFRWQKKMGELVNSDAPAPVRRAAMIGQVLPEVLNDLAMQIYPNLIGLNPKSHIQHLIQPFYKLWPELGFGKYSSGVLLRSLLKTIVEFPRKYAQVGELGLEPAAHVARYNRLTSEGMRANPVYSGAMNAANLTGQAVMQLYGKIFTLNKMIARSVGEVLASDLEHNPAGVQSIISRLPGSVQRALAGASPEEAARILSQHFSDVSVYNYSQPAKSEFGRTMGNMMSTFTKWPLATAGDILADFRTKSAGKATAATLRKYFAPYLALRAVQYYAFGPEDEMSDRAKKLLGHGGLAGMAPLMSIGELRHREFGTPPVLDTLIKNMVIPALNGDPDAIKRGVANSIQQFTPGSVYVRFFTDDLPTYIYGSRPGGEDFLERSEQGFKQLTR